MKPLSREKFHALAEKAFADLPGGLKALLVNVEIAAMARPGREAGKWAGSRRLLGLYVGLTRAEMGLDAGPHMPARVVLYQRNLEASCKTKAALEAAIRDTLRHELGHHLGLSDAAMRKLGC